MFRRACEIGDFPAEWRSKPEALHCSDLPGCVATGATIEETERLLREAIAVHIAGMREDGLPVPAPSSVVDYVEVSS